jgi:preprotein translocase subunit SecA
LNDLSETIFEIAGVHVDLVGFNGSREDLEDQVFNEIGRYYRAREEAMGPETYHEMQTYLYLQSIDARWKEHLAAMDHLREGIHLRGYGQKDPKQEYKKEGFTMFEMLMALIRDEVLEKVFKAQMKNAEGEDQLSALRREQLALSQNQSDSQVASHPSAGQAAKPGMMPQAGAPRLRPASSANNGEMPGGGGAPAKMNRAQRRKLQAKDRKKPKARPSVGS